MCTTHQPFRHSVPPLYPSTREAIHSTFSVHDDNFAERDQLPSFICWCPSSYADLSTEPLPSSVRGLRRQTHKLFFDTKVSHRKRHVPTIAHYFVYLLKVEYIYRTVAQQKQREYTYRHTDWWEEFMKYPTEVDSGATVYIPSFIKISSDNSKVCRGTSTQTRRRSHKPTLGNYAQSKKRI
jgi:hypothetical protein